jgi:hypothetical protein
MADQEAQQTARTRTVVELHLRDLTIQSPRGALTSICGENAKGIKMVADLDARTIGVKIPGKGTAIIPFESTKYFKYGMGRPKVD